MSHSREALDPTHLRQREDDELPCRVGPVLFFRGCSGGRLELGALFIRQLDAAAPVVKVGDRDVAADVLLSRSRRVVYRCTFSVPAETGGTYSVDGKSFDVAGISEGDLRIAYFSCNGQEHGDRERPLSERNAMWHRLAEQHARRPFNLLLQGGDQFYADDMLDAHPAVQQWAGRDVSRADERLSSEPPGEALRDYLLRGYTQLYSQPAPALMLAQVPSLCMWDDHDICDGWGSLPAERLDAPMGREVFQAAREMFLVFQLGCGPEERPPICPTSNDATLTWAVELPGVVLIAPDLRSERRPDRVMGSAGWSALESSLAATDGRYVFVLSSVPLLGPRLSWIEAAMRVFPGLQKYEDDLRDQWQSQAHRDEWRRILRLLLDVHERGSPVTVISGEIHLATRGTMATSGAPLHQLTASGIAHPPPTPWYGHLLGALARLGEAPLKANPIRLHPLPGQRSIYTAQRNFLLLERQDGRWSARWELEQDGTTPALEI